MRSQTQNNRQMSSTNTPSKTPLIVPKTKVNWVKRSSNISASGARDPEQQSAAVNADSRAELEAELQKEMLP